MKNLFHLCRKIDFALMALQKLKIDFALVDPYISFPSVHLDD